MKTSQVIDAIIESASVDFGKITYSYSDEKAHYFLTNETFEIQEIIQVDISTSEIWAINTRFSNQLNWSSTDYYVNSKTLEIEER